MTYCLAIALQEGLVFASDSRIRSEDGQIITTGKMHCFGRDGERQLVLLTAGNLATTQAVVAQLRRDLEGSALNLDTLDSVGGAADYLGGVFLETRTHYGDTDTSTCFILGGQIGSDKPEVMLVYPQGNHITTSNETPYLQIGESKYGKPVLDRFLDPATGLDQAARCAMISMDSTMRSNSLVGPPVELLLYERDSLCPGRRLKLSEDSDYLREIRRAWEANLQAAFETLAPIPALGMQSADQD